MRAFLKLLKQIITAGSGVSSKRVCGLLGWLVLLVCLGYATWNSTELPMVTPDFIFGTIVLLGVDSVTAIWKRTPARAAVPEPEPTFPRDHKPSPGSSKKHQLVEDDLPTDECLPSTDPVSFDEPEPTEPGSLNNAQL